MVGILSFCQNCLKVCNNSFVTDRILTFFEKKTGCLKFRNGEVWVSCGLAVHKSTDAYLSSSAMCDSVIISSSPVCSGDLSKLCFNSSFP